MRFISWVTFLRKLWMNPWNICKFVCRGPSVETWPCTSQFLKLGPKIDAWFGPSSPKQHLANWKKKKKMADIWPAKRFPKSWNWWKVNDCFFLVRQDLSTVLVSLVQITCQNFRSEVEKMSTAQRHWLVLSVLAGPACTTKLGPHATVQAKFGWDLREYLTFGLPLAPALT